MDPCDQYFESQPPPSDLAKWTQKVQAFVAQHLGTDRPVALVTVYSDVAMGRWIIQRSFSAIDLQMLGIQTTTTMIS